MVGKLDYYSKEYRDKRRRALRYRYLTQALQEDPTCQWCGLDLLELAVRRHELIAARNRVRLWCLEVYGSVPLEFEDPVFPVERTLMCMGFHKPSSPLAEADHIKPLWAGGIDHEINLQVLCQPCHREKTKQESKTRGRMKRRQRR